MLTRRYYKLSHIFFFNFIAVLTVALVILSLVIYYSIRQIEIAQLSQQLKSEIAYVDSKMSEGNSIEVATKEIVKIMHRPIRVTLITQAGDVLFDNTFDPRTMPNLANRPEVMGARRTGFATAVRFDPVKDKEVLYAARMITFNGKKAILRLSFSLDGVFKDFKALWLRIVVIFVLAVGAGALMSYLVRRRIDDELEKLTDYLQHLADKKYDAHFSPGFTQEFRTIGKLLKRLARRLEKTERKRRKYTAKLRLIGKQRSDIISAISHEFKNPVAAILGYVETLRDDPDLPLKIRQKFLERIEQNGRRISQMIDRLSFATRLESSEIEPKMSDFDLNSVVEEAAAAMEKKYPGRHIRLETEPTPIHADKTMMELVVINLMDNALKYSDDDIEVTLNSARFCVKDYGHGIPEKEREAITKKFYRLDKNSWDNSLGLGLSIVTYILNRHGLQLQIESTVGEGSRFCFELPEERIENIENG